MKSIKAIFFLLIMLALESCKNPNLPEQITDKIPEVKNIPYLCYLAENDDICILDALGNNKIVAGKSGMGNMSAFRGRGYPLISKNGEFLAYLKNNDLYIMNLKKNTERFIEKFYEETSDYTASEILLTGWSDTGDYFIYFRECPSTENELLHRINPKKGFYYYNTRNEKTTYIRKLGGFLQFVPNSNTILCYELDDNKYYDMQKIHRNFEDFDNSGLEHNLSYYYIETNKFEKFKQFPLLTNGFKISGNNTLAYVQFKPLKDIHTWIEYLDLRKNKVYHVTQPDENEDYQGITISEDGRFLVFNKEKKIEGRSSPDDYLVIYDVYKDKQIILEPDDYAVYKIIDRWLIYSVDKKIISRDLYTGSIKTIAIDFGYFF